MEEYGVLIQMIKFILEKMLIVIGCVSGALKSIDVNNKGDIWGITQD